jgi:hypothetical protein
VVAGHSVELDPVRWQELFDQSMGRVAGRFARADLRRRARAFVRGLLADVPRKNCWTIAEHVGDPGATLVIDETGDLKKGTHTVGCSASTPAPRVGWRMPRSRSTWSMRPTPGMRWWTGSCTCPAPGPTILSACRVGVPDEVGFATKPKLATTMICRALDAGVPAAWVTGDEVYGANSALRAELEGRGVGYVLAVARDHRVSFGGISHRIDELLRQVPARAWQCVSAGAGAKGHRLYDWAFVRLNHDGPAPGEQAGKHWLMVRRNRKTGELAFYRCFMPRPSSTPLGWCS